MTLSLQDLQMLDQKGITEAELNSQLRRFATGFPFLNVKAPATPGNGILTLSPVERNRYAGLWESYLRQGGSVVKMVPASGAASRMFKNLFAYVESAELTPFMQQFFAGIRDFAFFPELDAVCRRLYGLGVDELVAESRGTDVVKALIGAEGMNYGQLPKALLTFHASDAGVRTALEEQLAEGAQYAAVDGKVHVHFTVSPDHKALMENKITEVIPVLERKYGVKYIVDMSVQKSSTDTVAVNLDGTPYRQNGELFFRPAGHGALLSNLADLQEEVVFIKNIDNVVPDSRRETSDEYKKVLGGILVDVRNRIEHYAEELCSGLPSRESLDEMLGFLRGTLFVTDDTAAEMDDIELADYLLCKFNRPVRVCGMVRNEGEPGGGPFLAQNPDGTVSPQILESTQLDPESPRTPELFKAATHFNPNDLVCFIRDFDDEPFDLKEYVDSDTGFISLKSVKGHEIKALELPGLWNGSMSDWNTIFVEVPAETFNPVKTVNDLLRPAHQA